ncbi:MAG: DUF4202 family protein [Patescibacteria group bacterium]|nr:DUF4202 family protein [Patescibacteria group bacterium]
MFEIVKQFVTESFTNNIFSAEGLEHFERTVYWVKQLKPDADEAMLIAAYAHDIERAFRGKSSTDTFKNKEFNDPDFLAGHETKGAEIITQLLQEHHYDEEKIKRVAHMIRHHEEGGDEESNLIKDADSISYLEINAVKHVQLADKLGADKIIGKIDWMYHRISSDEAIKLAQPFYKKMVAMLKSVR